MPRWTSSGGMAVGGGGGGRPGGITMSIDALDRATATITAVTTKIDALGAATQRTSAQTAKMTTGMHSMLAVTRGMFIRMAAMAAAMAALGIATQGTIGAAMDFEDSFAGIRKTVDATEKEFKALEAANRRLARSMPITAVEFNNLGQIAGQMGVRGVENIVNFERVMAMLATSTNLTAEQAAFAFARIAKVTETPIKNIENMASVVVGLGNTFATTESEITDFAERIAGSASALGFTVGQILAIGAAFTEAGVKTERGATAVQKTLIEMRKAIIEGGDELTLFAAVTQMTEDRFTELARLDPAEAFIRFTEGLRASGDDAIRVLDALGLADARLVASMFNIIGTGDSLRRALEEQGVLFRENTAATDEYNKFAATTSKQLKIMMNQWADIGISIGKLVLPAIRAATTASSALAGAMKVLADHAHLTGLALAFLFNLNPLGFFAAKWRQIFMELPKPVQDFTINVLSSFDGLVNGVITALDTILLAINKFTDAIGKPISILSRLSIAAAGAIGLSGPTKKAIDALAGLADIPTTVGLGPSNLAGPLRQIQREQNIQKFLESINEQRDVILAVIRDAKAMRAAIQGEGIPGLKELLDALLDTDKKIDILADGIIDLWEAIEHGLNITQVVALETGRAIEEFANRAFRAVVELIKAEQQLANIEGIRVEALVALTESQVENAQAARTNQVALQKLYITLLDTNTALHGAARLLEQTRIATAQAAITLRVELVALEVLLGQQGLAGEAASFRYALAILGESFQRVEETTIAFHHRLAHAAMDAAQTRFDALFNRPTQEQAQLNLTLADAQRRRALLLQAGASEERVDIIDQEIDRIQAALDLRRAEEDIMKARADIVNATLLTESEQMRQAQFLIGAIAQQSVITDTLNDMLAVETIALAASIGALGNFTDALIVARDVLSGGRQGAGGFAVAGATGRPALGAGTPALNFSVQVNVDPQLADLRQEVLRTVETQLREQLQDAGFGGTNISTGTYLPA